jgi:hypothetical protein
MTEAAQEMSRHGPRGIRVGLAMAGMLPFLAAGTAIAGGRVLTAQDYARAERFMPYDTQPLVDHDVQRVHWLDDRRFWFVDHDAAGDRYRVMSAPGGRVTAAFDQDKLAAALSQATGKPVPASKLAITGIRIEGSAATPSRARESIFSATCAAPGTASAKRAW